MDDAAAPLAAASGLPESKGATSGINALAVAPDGRFAVADFSGTLELREATGVLIRAVSLTEPAGGLAFSRDGTRLTAACASRSCELSVPALAELRSVAYERSRSPSPTVFSVLRSGGRMIRLTVDGGMPVSDLETGRIVDVLAPPFAPTLIGGDLEGVVLAGNDDGRVAIIDPVRSAVAGTLSLDGQMITGLAV